MYAVNGMSEMSIPTPWSKYDLRSITNGGVGGGIEDLRLNILDSRRINISAKRSEAEFFDIYVALSAFSASLRSQHTHTHVTRFLHITHHMHSFTF